MHELCTLLQIVPDVLPLPVKRDPFCEMWISCHCPRVSTHKSQPGELPFTKSRISVAYDRYDDLIKKRHAISSSVTPGFHSHLHRLLSLPMSTGLAGTDSASAIGPIITTTARHYWFTQARARIGVAIRRCQSV